MTNIQLTSLVGWGLSEELRRRTAPSVRHPEAKKSPICAQKHIPGLGLKYAFECKQGFSLPQGDLRRGLWASPTLLTAPQPTTYVKMCRGASSTAIAVALSEAPPEPQQVLGAFPTE